MAQYDLDDCPPELLCAQGEGSSPAEAEKNAKESLAKIFETRVTGGAESHSSRESSFYRKQYRESYDEVLRGVQILRRHSHRGLFFALASLHKKKSAQFILRRTHKENVNLTQHYRKSDMDGFLATFKIWQSLADRYFFLTGKPLAPKVGYEKMLKKMQKLQALRSRKKILIETGHDEVSQHLIKNLASLGYRTTNQDTPPYHIKLVVKMKTKRLHLNVPQFKKYEFSLQITVYNSVGIQKDVLSLKKIQIGRTEKHARDLAMKNIFVGLEKKIDWLLKE